MPKRPNPFADIPPMTDFESCQKARPLVLQGFATLLGVWQVCANRSCARARQCKGHSAPCLAGFMQAIPDEERREIRYTVQNAARGLSPDEAVSRAQARVAEEDAGQEG